MIYKWGPVLLTIPAILFFLTASGAISQKTSPPRFTPAAKKYLEAGPFQEVHVVAALPHCVKVALAKMEGQNRFGMANPGQPFQSTDVVDPGNLPWRRLVFAGVSEKYCLVEYERGGIGLSLNADFFRIDGNQALLVWSAYTADCKNMKELRSELNSSDVTVTSRS